MSGYLLDQGIHAKDWSADARQATEPGIEFTKALQDERRLTLLKIAGARYNPAELSAVRQRLDTAIAATRAAPPAVQKLNPDEGKQVSELVRNAVAQLANIRQAVDAGQLSVQQAYEFFTTLTGVALMVMNTITLSSPSTKAIAEAVKATQLFYALEAVDRSSALSAAAFTHGGLPPALLSEYSSQVGVYHSAVDTSAQVLDEPMRTEMRTLVAGPSWKQLSQAEDAVLRRGPVAASDDVAPVGLPDWQKASVLVSQDLQAIWQGQYDETMRIATDYGNRAERNSLLSGAAALLLALGAFGVALWLSGTLIRRLRLLRGETLALADVQLPQLMDRLRTGEQIDPGEAAARLDFGWDEIGQVAEAFNRAHHAAVSAAITEAKTREGVNAVFLNIAHRSQVVVHRQLEILDKAENEQDNPRQLEVLFQLDHLATRERRNAENLIILGGEQPGRRWRSPVPLMDLVRSAVAETENYARVQVNPLPVLLIAGTVVADLIHLLAELLDNATSFSPPGSRVEVSGNVVGKGVVVEISDQGLGMTIEEIERINEQMRNPPGFSISSLSSDSRLGLFVVARLASRNGTSVRFAESDYGGIRAIVLVPTTLISTDPDAQAPQPEPAPVTANGL